MRLLTFGGTINKMQIFNPAGFDREKLLRCNHKEGHWIMQATALNCPSASDAYASKRRPRLGATFFLSVVKAVVRGSTSEIKLRKKSQKITISVKIMRFQPKLWLNVVKMLL